MFFLPVIGIFLLSWIPDKPLPEVNYQVTYAYHYDAHDKQMLDQSVILLNRVENGQCFRDAVLNAHFTETNGMSNRKILRTLLSGLDGKGNISVRMVEFDNPNTNVIGFVRYDIPGTIFQNHQYMWNVYAMAANMLHEASHLEGFNHDDERHMFTTVPYQASELFADCISFSDLIP